MINAWFLIQAASGSKVEDLLVKYEEQGRESLGYQTETLSRSVKIYVKQFVLYADEEETILKKFVKK